MHGYHEEHKTFPPVAVFDKNGKPLLSWRVLLLPFIEQHELYKQFKLDEPWDSAHNITLLSKMPAVFEPFRGGPGQPGTTFYRVFVGTGAAFEGMKGMRLPDDFPDGTSNTILIAQAEEAVPWTKPSELSYSPTSPLPSLGGIFPNSLQVALGDGSTRSLSMSVSEQTLRAAITRNGGEELGADW